MRDRGTKLRRIKSLIDAATRVDRRRSELVPELLQSTGLTAEGIDLAFDRHLELAPRESDLNALIQASGDTESVVVILSSNVFVAPLRAIALAVAAAPVVVVRPSRRDPIFARTLVNEFADSAVTTDEAREFVPPQSGEVHVYGRDETIAAIRAKLPAAVRMRAHGAGMGIALVSPLPNRELSEAAKKLARDVVPFDQRGCLSPRIVGVAGPPENARTFAHALTESLDEWAERIPRGTLNQDEREKAATFAQTWAFAGQVYRGRDHIVSLANETKIDVPPTGRFVHVFPVASVDALPAALRPLARYIVAVGTNEPETFAPAIPLHARISELGEMQRPPLDGPVDRRDEAR